MIVSVTPARIGQAGIDRTRGTTVHDTCYASGTLIRTPRGDVAIESLQIGDAIVTASGAQRPIRWLGHRTVDCRSHREPRKVWPVRVAENAFGPAKPERDLFVSPGHCLCVTAPDPMLIPAASLVNGSTVAQVEVDTVTYWHIELDSHDVLLANGLPAESYLDTGNRRFFADAGGTVDQPDAAPYTRDDVCHPFHPNGPLVDGVRKHLTAQAETLGWTPDTDADLHLVVDDQVVRPFGEANTAVFVFPAKARKVRLVSKTFMPADSGGKDVRRLGLRIYGLAVSGSSGAPRRIPFDDPALKNAFHAGERETNRDWRWTQGDLALPPALWTGLSGDIVLHLYCVSTTVRGYQPPQEAAGSKGNGPRPTLYAVTTP